MMSRKSAVFLGMILLLAWSFRIVPGSAALAGGMAGKTFTCRTFGYSLVVPAGWHLTGADCAKPAIRLLSTPDQTGVIGVQIVNYDGDTRNFQTMVTGVLGQLGLPASSIGFGQQTLRGIHYDLAVFSPPATNTGKRLWAYLLGTRINNINYLLQGYVYTDQVAQVNPLILQMRDIFASIRYFKGTFHAAPPKPTPAPNSGSLANLIPFDGTVVGFIILAVLCIGAAVAILVVAARPAPPRPLGRRR
jgi:hypothetical protein